MTTMSDKLKTRADRKTRKRAEKKRQIAESALQALKELGYANTSLRDIAAKSDLSLGMLHYYFEDRSALIIYCVQLYKRRFVREMLEAMARAEGREEVIEAFSAALVTSIIDDEMTHRLWYDIRTQAMFDDAFRPAVAEIEGLLIGITKSAFDRAGVAPPEGVEMSYAMLDGAFRHLMQGQIGDHPRSREELVGIFQSLIARFI